MPGSPGESQRCFYSHRVGHVIAYCMSLKAKGERPHSDKQLTAHVGVLMKASETKINAQSDEVDPAFQLFL